MPPTLRSSADIIPALRHPLTLRSLLPSLHDLAPRLSAQETPLRPTRILVPRTLASLFQRQVTVTATATSTALNHPIIPATYSGLGTGPSPGTIVGIVFGSVGGFLLILWLIYTCFNLGGNMRGSSSVIEEETVVRRRSRSPRRTSTRRSSPRRREASSPSSRSASEVIEIQSTRTRERTPPRREPRREIIVEETIRRAPQQEDDVIEVLEEHSDHTPRREKSERRERDRRVSGGFRTVDPEAFAGGSRPVRKVSRRDGR